MGVLTEVMSGVKSSSKVLLPLVTPVRFRYHADKIAKQGIFGYGFKNKLYQQGLLPRDKSFKSLPQKVYTPSNPWSKKNARKGANDFIDILGNERMIPSDVHYDTPAWLRGFRGNELQGLIHRLKYHGEAMKQESPDKHRLAEERMMYLFKKFNYRRYVRDNPTDRFTVQ